MDYFSAIRAFLHAANLGSFSKAAERIEVKTSTVSRCIQDLEADLGIALFNRSTRGLVLTEGGRIFREKALLVIQSLDEAREITAALNTFPQGLLRVTVPSLFGRQHIIPHLPTFLELYQKIDVDVVVTDNVLNIIDSGIDLAIRIGALPDSQMMARKLAEHRQVVCASPNYVMQRGAPEVPLDLVDHVTLRHYSAIDDRWFFVNRGDDTFLKKEAVQLRSRLRVDDTEALVDLTHASYGIALLPVWATGPALRENRLVQLLPDWDVSASQSKPAIWAVYPPKKTVSSKVRTFIDFFAAIYSQERYWEQ